MNFTGAYFFYDKISYWGKRKYYRLVKYSNVSEPCVFHSFGNTWCHRYEGGELNIRIDQCSADMVTFFEMNNIPEKGIIGGYPIMTSNCCEGNWGVKEFIEDALFDREDEL